MSRNLIMIALLILLASLATSSMSSIYGPRTFTKSTDKLKAEIEGSLDLGNADVEQIAVTIAKDYPGEYNINQVSAVYDALRKGWYYYSDPSYKERYKHANRTLQDGKISNSIGMGDCDDFAVLLASLLESLQGSTRIVFAYDQDTRKNHAYVEVYLGKKRDPRVDKLIGWLKDQYNQNDIPGQTISGDEVWLNLDYDSTFPGGLYFGEGHRVEREVVWQSASRNSPKIVPIIDTMDSTAGWEVVKDDLGSNAIISMAPARKGRGSAINITYGLKEGGWIGIAKKISPDMLARVAGLNFSCYAADKQSTVELRLGQADGTEFGYSWKPDLEKWVQLQALYEDFRCLGSAKICSSPNDKLDPYSVEKLELIISSLPEGGAGPGEVIIDHVQGVMNVPAGSPWARAEELRKISEARRLAAESERAREKPSGLIQSVMLAIESLSMIDTLEGNNALRSDLDLLPRCLAQLQHNDSVMDIAFSPDGSKLATTCQDNAVWIWDVKTGSELQRFNLTGGAIAFSPDGSKLATSRGNIVQIWDVTNGKELHRLVHNGSVISIVFSPDGSKLATASRKNATAGIWDVATGKILRRLYHDGWVNSVAFNFDGSKLATASYDDTARIWGVETGVELLRINYSDFPPLEIAFSPDGSKVATSSIDNVVSIRDVTTGEGEELQRLVHGGSVTSIAFSPDGSKLATASDDKTARIWDMETWAELQLNHDSVVSSVAFGPDGRKLATASGDHTAKIWDVMTGEELQRLVHGGSGSVASIAFSPDGSKLATASNDKTARIWDVENTGEMVSLKHDDWVFSVAFSPDGRKLATASEDGTARIWDVGTGAELKNLDHDCAVHLVAFSHDGGKLATGSCKETFARIWDVETGAKLHNLEHNDFLSAIAFSPDESKLATASWDNTSRIWDVETGKELHRLSHNGPVFSVAFSPDGRKLATASEDGTARIWDVTTGAELHKLGHNGSVYSVAFSPNGSKLATASNDIARVWDYTVQIWDRNTWEELKKLKHDGEVQSVAFSPDGSKLATASSDTAGIRHLPDLNSFTTSFISEAGSDKSIRIRDYTVQILDVNTWQELPKIKHDGEVQSVVFSPDSSKLATASEDHTAKIWDVETGVELQRLVHGDSLMSIAFSPDGGEVATASKDGTARIWALNSRDLICQACSRLECNLTSQEWRDEYCGKCTNLGADSTG